VPLAQPGKELHHGSEASALRRDPERLTVLFAIGPHRPLVALQDRTRDLPGVKQVTFLRPCQERLELLVAVLNGHRRAVADAHVIEILVRERGERGALAGESVICLRVTALPWVAVPNDVFALPPRRA
jgi:hypothetical protein